MDPTSLPVILSTWRNTKWWSAFQKEWEVTDPQNLSRWRHSRTGSHHRWDQALVHKYGVDWQNLTQDRVAWKRLEEGWVLSEHSRLTRSRYLAIAA